MKLEMKNIKVRIYFDSHGHDYKIRHRNYPTHRPKNHDSEFVVGYGRKHRIDFIKEYIDANFISSVEDDMNNPYFEVTYKQYVRMLQVVNEFE